MRKLIVVIASLVALATVAQASDPDIRWHRNGMTVIMHSGTTPISVVVGENKLDALRSFNCRSAAGCIVISTAAVKETDGIGTYPCTYVDGTAGAPGCWYISNSSNNTSIQTAHQQIAVAQGSHTIQSRFHSDNSVGQIDSWETDYQIYERPVH